MPHIRPDALSLQSQLLCRKSQLVLVNDTLTQLLKALFRSVWQSPCAELHPFYSVVVIVVVVGVVISVGIVVVVVVVVNRI